MTLLLAYLQSIHLIGTPANSDAVVMQNPMKAKIMTMLNINTVTPIAAGLETLSLS